jgi:hypothetical protein
VSDSAPPVLVTTLAEATEFDMYAQPPPEGDWNYIVDDAGTVYYRPSIPPRLRAGVWPFARAGAEHKPWSVRLAPDCEFRSWRNEYVLAWPDEDKPHLARADLRLWAGKHGIDGNVVPVTVNLDLRAGQFVIGRVPVDAPVTLLAQADEKARKLVAYLTAECERRDGNAGKAPVTASDLEERREDERAEKIRVYCAENGLSYERLPLFGSDRFVINGERLAVHAVAARYLPGLFSTSPAHSRVQGEALPASAAQPQRSGRQAGGGASASRRARSADGRRPAMP